MFFPLSFLLPSSRILLEDDDVKEMLLTAGGEPFDSDSDQVTFRFHDFVVDESEHASRGFLPMNLPGRRDDDGHESEEHEDENDDGHDEDGHDGTYELVPPDSEDEVPADGTYDFIVPPDSEDEVPADVGLRLQVADMTRYHNKLTLVTSWNCVDTLQWSIQLQCSKYNDRSTIKCAI